MTSIQNNFPSLHLQQGIYQGSSQFYLQDIWLKIKKYDEGIHLSLNSKNWNIKKLKIKLSINTNSLMKMNNRFQGGQRNFIVQSDENDLVSFKLAFSDHAINLINAEQNGKDILGFNFVKIAELQKKSAFKYEDSPRIFKALNSPSLFIKEIFITTLFFTILMAVYTQSENLFLSAVALSIIALMNHRGVFPAIGQGSSTRGINFPVNDFNFSCFHIYGNTITVYFNPILLKNHRKFDKIIYVDLLDEYRKQKIELNLFNIQPYNKSHEYLHNLSDPFYSRHSMHTHIQFDGISAITPRIFNIFIERLMNDELLDPNKGQSVINKFTKAFIT